jgi:hypothetical protein
MFIQLNEVKYKNDSLYMYKSDCYKQEVLSLNSSRYPQIVNNKRKKPLIVLAALFHCKLNRRIFRGLIIKYI